MQCQECQHFKSGPNSSGQCRRNPPVFKKTGDEEANQFRGYWPLVEITEWCGEHKSKINWDVLAKLGVQPK